MENTPTYRPGTSYGHNVQQQQQPGGYPAYGQSAPPHPSAPRPNPPQPAIGASARPDSYQQPLQSWQGQQQTASYQPQQQQWTQQYSAQSQIPQQSMQTQPPPSGQHAAGTSSWQQPQQSQPIQQPVKRRLVEGQTTKLPLSEPSTAGTLGGYAPSPTGHQDRVGVYQPSATHQQGSAGVSHQMGVGYSQGQVQTSTASYPQGPYAPPSKQEQGTVQMQKSVVQTEQRGSVYHQTQISNVQQKSTSSYPPGPYAPVQHKVEESKPKLRPLAEIFAVRRDPPQQQCVLCSSGMQVEYTAPHPWAHCCSNSCAYTQNVIRSPAVASDGSSAPPPPHKCTVCYGDIVPDQLVRVLEGGSFSHADWSQCEVRPIEPASNAAVAAAASLGYSMTHSSNPSLPRCGICFSGGPADTVIGGGRCVHVGCLQVDVRRLEATESARKQWNAKVGGNRLISPVVAPSPAVPIVQTSMSRPETNSRDRDRVNQGTIDTSMGAKPYAGPLTTGGSRPIGGGTSQGRSGGNTADPDSINFRVLRMVVMHLTCYKAIHCTLHSNRKLLLIAFRGW